MSEMTERTTKAVFNTYIARELFGRGHRLVDFRPKSPPRSGAWIEIRTRRSDLLVLWVAPRPGGVD